MITATKVGNVRVLTVKNVKSLDLSKMIYESSAEQMSTKSYSSQRKERLDEAMFDYISDEQSDAQQTYDDLIDVIKSDAAYFKRYYEKCRDLLWKMGYYGSVDEEVPVKDRIKSVVDEHYISNDDDGTIKIDKFRDPKLPERF